jgi:hypothetical protein
LDQCVRLKGMREHESTTKSAVRLLAALFFASLFALSFFLTDPSPERLLWQGIFVALVVDCSRPLLAKFNSAAIGTVSAVAYFALRTAFLAVMLSWFISRLPELISIAMSNEGSAFVFQVGHAVFLVIVCTLVATHMLFRIGNAVWSDAFAIKSSSTTGRLS